MDVAKVAEVAGAFWEGVLGCSAMGGGGFGNGVLGGEVGEEWEGILVREFGLGGVREERIGSSHASGSSGRGSGGIVGRVWEKFYEGLKP